MGFFFLHTELSQTLNPLQTQTLSRLNTNYSPFTDSTTTHRGQNEYLSHRPTRREEGGTTRHNNGWFESICGGCSFGRLLQILGYRDVESCHRGLVGKYKRLSGSRSMDSPYCSSCSRFGLGRIQEGGWERDL